MSLNLTQPRRRGVSGRGLQAVALLVAAIAQIALARLTDALNIGVNVELRSAVATHPLVPWSYAFSIWGVIFAWGLVLAIWQLLPAQKRNPAIQAVGWHFAAIFALNALWEVWVPLNGFDWVSAAIILISLITGISGLLKLRHDVRLSRKEQVLVFAPLALTTGWLTAAFSVNVTSILVVGAYPLDPTQVAISVGFLVGLILAGALITWLSESVAYAAALVWALFWILMGNIYRDSEPAMVTTCVIGIALVGLICAWAVTHHHESGPMHARR